MVKVHYMEECHIVNDIRKVDWHCPHCEYLHIKDTPVKPHPHLQLKCIVCKRYVDLEAREKDKSWKFSL